MLKRNSLAIGLLTLFCGQPKAMAAWNLDQLLQAAKCAKSLIAARRPGEKIELSLHQNFVAQQIVANQIFPQMSRGIEMYALAFALKNSGPQMSGMFDPAADTDIQAIGQAMNDAHKVMGINYRFRGYNPFSRKVSRDRLLQMLTGVNGAAAGKLDRTLGLLCPDYSPYVDIFGIVTKEMLVEVESRLVAFLATRPDAIDRLQKMGNALTNALKDPELKELAKNYRLGLQRPKRYDGPEIYPSHILRAMGRSIRREVGQTFPDLSERQVELYLRTILKIM
jgi:hypothetical protein